MITLAIILVIVGAILSWRGYAKKKEEKEKKSFVVLLTTLFLIYLFPGATLMILGLILILLILSGCIPY